MQVNPMYATDAAKNPSGTVFGDPLPTSFPKADPYCYQAPSFGPNNGVVPPLLCGTDWLPYTRGLDDSAAVTRTAADGAKVDINLQAQTSSDVWKREPPQFLGRRDMLAVTDVPSATRFGLQIASLSRAGDNGASRAFLDADAAGLAAGVAAMKSQTEPQVLEPDPTATAPSAYPLTTVVYGAVRPLSLSAVERNDFSAFISYASGPGQVPGLELGQLPRGYAVLPDGLKAQAQAAAATVVSITAPPPTTTTATSTTTAATVQSVGGTVRRTGGGSTGSVPPASDTTVQSSTTTAGPTGSVAPTTTPTTEPATTTTAVLTPGVSASAGRLAVPGLGLMALGSALGALEITKRPRRRTHPDAADQGGEASS
jgi:hypothetical protein